MADVSVIIPSRNEQFLTKTIKDIVSKTRIDTEVIAVLEGYWPPADEIVDHPRVHYIHHGRPKGMRAALNAGVAMSQAKFVMKLDGHCMVGEGFDEVLASACQPDWVCVPRRHRLDPENWVISDGKRPAIDYLYLNNNGTLDGKLWLQKNGNKALEAERVVDLIICQGSCYFMHRDHWLRLGLLDEENYGTFRKDPQEVCFKTWTSGGRCVRVKDTWYAHLHKGKRYGRGYSASKKDWIKGDEYVKKWFTDDAWDERQIIPFKELLQRWPDMPGWEDHPWMLEVAKPKTYQYLEVDGKPLTRTAEERTGSRFWNEGKWANFVEPLLPKDVAGQTFVEMGCDAGLFLKLATDKGYGRVIGVEQNETAVQAAIEYRDAIGYDYSVLNRTLGGWYGERGDFDIDELPMADMTLLSTFHYHIDISSWLKYVDLLRSKSRFCLVVSTTNRGYKRWRVNANPLDVMGYFRDWKHIGTVDDVPMEGDPKPRHLFSMLFKSPLLERIPTAEIVVKNRGSEGENGIRELTKQVVAGDDIVIGQTALYKDWRYRRRNWSDEQLAGFVELKVELIQSLIKHGPRDPLLVERDTIRLCDGSHRLVILETLGYESVIVREV